MSKWDSDESDSELGSAADGHGSPHDRPHNPHHPHHHQQQAPAALPLDPLAALSSYPIHDPSFFLTAKGLTNLIVAPFFQGMFHGLGECIARILVGRVAKIMRSSD
ncbi:hypothetical protein HK105_204837 [Polyrhizophydium stewartii]|uniref:Uncharacterized protein n=1 Tax=Polyrhizophydium stewartii TaxID=2732419 RepID=A0ABR4N7Z1_9FUNG